MSNPYGSGPEAREALALDASRVWEDCTHCGGAGCEICEPDLDIASESDEGWEDFE